MSRRIRKFWPFCSLWRIDHFQFENSVIKRIAVVKHRGIKSKPRHDKTNKMSVRLTKTQISLGIRPVWSESSLCAQRVAKDPSVLHADSEDSDQNGLFWVFAGRTVILLVLSCRSSSNSGVAYVIPWPLFVNHDCYIPKCLSWCVGFKSDFCEFFLSTFKVKVTGQRSAL